MSTLGRRSPGQVGLHVHVHEPADVGLGSGLRESLVQQLIAVYVG